MIRISIALGTAVLAASASPALAAGKATPTPTPAATAVATSTTPPPSPWTAPAGGGASSSSPSTSDVAGTVTGPGHQENMSYRPEGKSIGIGAGWTFPSDLGTPNTVSARIRLESGLTIEPLIQLDANIGSSKVSGGGASATGNSSAINFIVGANLRKPMMSRNQVDIVGILSPAIQISTASQKPAGGTKNDSTIIGLGTGWGLGVEYWPKTHWSLSFNALNPLLAITSTSAKDGGTGQTTSGTNFFVGADFNPTVQLMTHIYY